MVRKVRKVSYGPLFAALLESEAEVGESSQFGSSSGINLVYTDCKGTSLEQKSVCRIRPPSTDG